MKKKFLLLAVLILLLLGWLALDDITTGTEPNFFTEYAILAASVPAFLFLGYTIFKNTR